MPASEGSDSGRSASFPRVASDGTATFPRATSPDLGTPGGSGQHLDGGAPGGETGDAAPEAGLEDSREPELTYEMVHSQADAQQEGEV